MTEPAYFTAFKNFHFTRTPAGVLTLRFHTDGGPATFTGPMFGVFGRLFAGEDMPAWEQAPQVPVSLGRLQRGAAWIMAVLAAVAAAMSVLLSEAAAVVSGGRRGRARALVAKRGRTRPGRQAGAQPRADQDQ